MVSPFCPKVYGFNACWLSVDVSVKFTQSSRKAHRITSQRHQPAPNNLITCHTTVELNYAAKFLGKYEEIASTLALNLSCGVRLRCVTFACPQGMLVAAFWRK